VVVASFLVGAGKIGNVMNGQRSRNGSAEAVYVTAHTSAAVCFLFFLGIASQKAVIYDPSQGILYQTAVNLTCVALLLLVDAID